MKPTLTIPALMLLCLPTMAHAQSTARVEANASARAEARSGNSGAAGQAALSANAAAGLPEAPVHRTIAEGEAKGASRSEIDRAAMATHTRLRVARETLSDDGERRVSDAEITAGASALASGATRAELGRVRDAAPAQRSLAASLNALAQLHTRGLGGMQAAASIATRLRQGASDQAISGFATSTTATAELAGSAAGQARGATSVGVDAAANAGASLRGVGAGLGAAGGMAGSLGGL